ncbi:hypothetical protein DV736_g4349, partial [Chaetothyriales sp. CBS 134916]
MIRIDTVCLWVALSSAALLVFSYETSIAYDRPVHIFVVALGVAAFTLVSTAKAIPALFATSPATHVSSSFPSAKTPPDDARLHNLRICLPVLAAAVAAITARLEVYRQVSKATECTLSSVEVWLPLLLLTYDCVRTQRYHLDLPSEDTAGLVARLKLLINRYRLRPGSWYIPPITAVCGMILDFALALLVYETMARANSSATSSNINVLLWGTVLFVSALIWTLVGAVLYVFKPEWRVWLLLLDTPSFLATSSAIFLQSILLSVLLISALHTIVVSGIFSLALALTVLGTLLPVTAFLWAFRDPFPLAPPITLAFGFFLIYLGWWSFHQVRHTLDPREPGPVRPGLKLLVIVILLVPAWIKQSLLSSHPIDLLLLDADRSHQAYFKATELDPSLAQVVSRYKDRYGRTPPPGFDIWWEYATNRSTVILDEYDQIYEDLLPFWAIHPADIRQQTWEIISNPWNEIAGISIRGGVATVQENILPTHRWMLEGITVLVNAFARYLPDMDLAFNLNDESRVAVPYDRLQSLRRQGEATKSFGTASWSPNRASGWRPITKVPNRDTVFHDLSFHNTFGPFGSVGCPPSSASRARSRIASQSTFCYSCAEPHSTGQFLSNWTLAADVCHQPDLAYLHGFYLSPAAFKATHSLRPVFSQSKPHPYNDILYPSAWNYMDKVFYAPSEYSGKENEPGYMPGFLDPPFSDKENTLFWRGATSEGVSSSDPTWRGMARQRLIHLANNLTAHPHDDVTLFLPTVSPSTSRTSFTYVTLPGSSVSTLGLSVDARVVDHISRCGMRDCTDQDAEFSPASVPTTDFQAHWQYKYLFDLDGAGFSGRFLPFLQSRSLPFKTALFREWYDSRLTAWKHFVPVDLRLHGVWSTLAYFAGVDGWTYSRGGLWRKRVVWAPHEREAETIALAGREWSSRVLRKEDMEVYFFRLLLEWARVTDDERRNLGFDV